MIEPIKTAIWDIETNGLLPGMDRVHCLVVRDFERRTIHRFRSNNWMDNINQGIELITKAEVSCGHNIIGFDIPALEKVYGELNFEGKIYDTLVMSRMVFANQKDKDYRLYEAGKLPGGLIGAHGLEAWGYRLGLNKGNYKKEMEAKGLDPWAEWNQDMEDYCDNDVEVTTLLYARAASLSWDPHSIQLEHEIAELMAYQEQNGVDFDVPKAEKLVAELETESTKLVEEAKAHFGFWWAPERKKVTAPLWDDPDGKNAAKTYVPVEPLLGEDVSRKIWAHVVNPTKTMKFKDPNKISREAGVMFCPIVYKEFNPASRDHIIDRLTTVYDWEPNDFTDTGRPSVNDEVLRVLAKGEGNHPPIPIAESLAEIFYYEKRLGMLVKGQNAWLKMVGEDGRIHHYCNVGGTISGRASHVGPNLGQVPALEFKKNQETGKDEIRYGREGHHGYECRELFTVPDGWWMVGSDLSGIELRCLGEKLSQFDKGAYLDIVLNGDVHSYNQKLAGLPTRNNAKTFIYALIYGAGDAKLGSIVDPLASVEEQEIIGAKLRKLFMENLPAMQMLLNQIKKMSRNGMLPGLDGRKLHVRSPHSALNTLLQSDAAIIAKKWVLLCERNITNQLGGVHSWNGNFVQLLWVHDEIQQAVRAPLDPKKVGEVMELSAKEAGRYFNYQCPVEAKSKIGKNWAETH